MTKEQHTTGGLESHKIGKTKTSEIMSGSAKKSIENDRDERRANRSIFKFISAVQVPRYRSEELSRRL